MYTHTFEFIIDGINVSGEISFNSGKPKFKTDSIDELTIKQHAGIQRMFEYLVSCYTNLGDIQKIEVIKKP
jgi:hypothetical protein